MLMTIHWLKRFGKVQNGTLEWHPLVQYQKSGHYGDEKNAVKILM
jgi:hypothetical protein